MHPSILRQAQYKLPLHYVSLLRVTNGQDGQTISKDGKTIGYDSKTTGEDGKATG